MTDSNLKRKTMHGLFWSGIDNFSNMGITFVIGIVLARRLSPEDYGLIAMIMVFLGLSRSVIDSGFGSALIRKPDLKDEDCSTALVFNLVVASLFYVGLYAIAPWVALFYEKPILISLLRVEALCIILNSLVIVQTALVNRRIDFKTTTKISLTSNVLSGLLAIYLAYRDWGVWALVAMHISAALISVILFWTLSKWKASLRFSRESFRYLFGFGSKLLVSGLIDVIFQHLYPIVIGKYFSTAGLGHYTKANNLAKLPSSSLTGVIQRVTFPVLSQLQEDDERLRDGYRRLLRMSVYIIFPLMLGMAAVAKPLVLLLLTEKWAPCIPYLQILCFSLMWFPVHAINLNLLQVKGRTDLFLKLDIVKRCLTIVIIICSIPYGIIGMCVGSVISSFICVIINTYYTGKLIHVGYWMQMRDMIPTLINSSFMALLAYGMTLMYSSNLLSLILSIILGGMFFLGCSYVFRMQELTEILSLIRKRSGR